MAQAITNGTLTSDTLGARRTQTPYAVGANSHLWDGTTDRLNDTELTEAGRQYAAAYAAHYTGRDLPVALQPYKKVIANGDVGSVRAAVEAGARVADQVGELVNSHVIPNPAAGVVEVFLA